MDSISSKSLIHNRLRARSASTITTKGEKENQSLLLDVLNSTPPRTASPSPSTTIVMFSNPKSIVGFKKFFSNSTSSKPKKQRQPISFLMEPYYDTRKAPLPLPAPVPFTRQTLVPRVEREPDSPEGMKDLMAFLRGEDAQSDTSRGSGSDGSSPRSSTETKSTSKSNLIRVDDEFLPTVQLPLRKSIHRVPVPSIDKFDFPSAPTIQEKQEEQDQLLPSSPSTLATLLESGEYDEQVINLSPNSTPVQVQSKHLKNFSRPSSSISSFTSSIPQPIRLSSHSNLTNQSYSSPSLRSFRFPPPPLSPSPSTSSSSRRIVARKFSKQQLQQEEEKLRISLRYLSSRLVTLEPLLNPQQNLELETVENGENERDLVKLVSSLRGLQMEMRNSIRMVEGVVDGLLNIE